MPKKKTYDEVKSMFEERGYILVSKEYVNSKTKLEYICPIHNEKTQYITYDSLRQGQGCFYCGVKRRNDKNRLDYNYVYNEFLKRGYQLLQDTYDNANEKMIYVCNKHPEYIQDITYGNLQQGHGCKYCGKEKGIQQRLVPFVRIQDLFLDREYTLLSEESEYKNNKTPLSYVCSKHPNKIQKISYNTLYNGEGCYFCGVESTKQKLKKDFDEVIKVFEKQGYKLLSTEEEYVNATSKLRYMCPKHNDVVLYTNYSSMYNGEGCPLCKESKGEKVIRNILTEMNIEFIPQKKFDDLKDIRCLSYDFYLPSYNMLIEYQGAFHDGTVHKTNPELQTKENLSNQKKHDDMKRDYAKNNGYYLLEIWYWDFKNIEEILKKELIK